MSIVALKRKSFTQFGSAHVDKQGVFSLNGTTRHPPASLGRAIQPTPMRGADPVGHGCGRRCRVPGRFARICGSSYPRIIKRTCEPFQTVVHPSVKNTSGRLENLYLGIHPVVKRIDTSMSFYSNNQRVVERHVVNPLQVCPPFFKDVGPMPYRDYVIVATTPCIAANP